MATIALCCSTAVFRSARFSLTRAGSAAANLWRQPPDRFPTRCAKCCPGVAWTLTRQRSSSRYRPPSAADERAVVNDLWRSDLTTSDNPLRCASTGITRLPFVGQLHHRSARQCREHACFVRCADTATRRPAQSALPARRSLGRMRRHMVASYTNDSACGQKCPTFCRVRCSESNSEQDQSPYSFCLSSRRCCASSDRVAVGRASRRGMPIGSPVSSHQP
jgi:hypothetical protein